MNNKKKKETNKSLVNKKNIILATLLFLAFLLICIITIVNYAKLKEEEDKINNKKDFENAIEEVKKDFIENGEIVPNRYNMFERMYEGEIDTSQIYPDIYNLVYITIPDIQKKFKGKDKNEIENFFKDNKSRIENNLGINNKEEYVKFVTYIKDLDLGLFVDATFDEINYKELESADQIPLELVYTKQTIKIYIEIERKENGKNPIKFKAM